MTSLPTFSLTHHGPITRIELKSLNKHTGAIAQVCAYRIGDTLIDTGSPLTLSATLNSLENDPPRRILLTHHHEDHTGGVAAICRQYGTIPVFCPEGLGPFVATIDTVPLYRAVHWGHPEPYKKLLSFPPGEIFTADDWQIEAIPTPGHTVGHMAFLISKGGEQYLLPGDLYLAETCYLAFAETSVPECISSLQRLIDIPGSYIALPSHGEVMMNPKTNFQKLQDWYKKETDLALQTAEVIGSTDYLSVFKARFGVLKALEKISEGELSRIALMRGIFEPVRVLPASPIRIPE